MQKVRISGSFVLLDDEDLERVMRKGWSVAEELDVSGNPTFRVYSTTAAKIPLGRFILGLEKVSKLMVDHINGDTLDNRKENLRAVTNAQNQMNRKVNSNSRTGFKGVREMSTGRFQARIVKDGVPHVIGHYFNAKSAGISYDNAAREMFGSYARLNFPELCVPTPVEEYATETGEKWVQPHKGRLFRVSIKATKLMPGYHSKGFRTIPDAVDHRNEFILISGQLVKDGRHYSYKTLPEDIRKKLYKENP